MTEQTPDADGARTVQRLTDLLDSLPDLAFRWDIESGSLDYASASWERVLGYSPRAMLDASAEMFEGLVTGDLEEADRQVEQKQD